MLTISATIQKIDDLGTLLPDARFALYHLEGDGDITLINDAFVTDSNGLATISSLTIGTYYLMEYKAPLNYDLDTLYFVIKIVVTQNTTTVNLEAAFFKQTGMQSHLTGMIILKL